MIIETYKINGWEDEETGLLLFENENWILVKHIPVDYQIDGYRVYCKKWIDARASESKESQIKHVLQLKGVDSNIPEGLEFDSAQTILDKIEKQYGLVEFQDSDSDELFYGKIVDVEDDEFSLVMVDSKGGIQKDFDIVFSFDEIRCITFNSDYFQSVRVLMNNPYKD